MISNYKTYLLGTLIFVVFFSLSAYSMSPEEVVEEFWNLIQEDELIQAHYYIHDNKQNAFLFLTNEVEESELQYMKFMLEYIELETAGYRIIEDQGIAEVMLKVKKPDLEEFLSEFIEKAFLTIFIMSMENADESEIEKEIDVIVRDILEEFTVREVEFAVFLKQVGKQWKLYDLDFSYVEERWRTLGLEVDRPL